MSTIASDLPSVLLVDDCDNDLLLFRRTWQKLGAERVLAMAEGGAEALRILGEGRAPELVLLDLKMPGVDGFDVLRALRAERRYDATRVAVLSSSMEPRDVRRAYEEGANAYLAKPASVETLRELLAQVALQRNNADPRVRLAVRTPGTF